MYRSQFLPQADFVGAMRFFPESGNSITFQDGSEWLKTGLVKNKTGYNIASITPSLQVLGIASTGTVPTGITDWAHNGSGTIVVVTGSDATNVHVSTDYGVTWSAVAHNLTVAACGVAYNGTTWIVVGNDATTFKISSSTAPTTTWTPRTSPTAFSGGTSNTASAAWDVTAGKFVVVAGGGTANFAAYSANGTTGWTAVNLATSLGANPVSVRASGSGAFVAVSQGTNTTQKSSDGITWTNGGTNIAGSRLTYALGGFIRVYSSINGYVYKSTDGGTTWSTISSTNTGEGGFGSGFTPISGDATTLMVIGKMPSTWMISSDGVNLSQKWTRGAGYPIYLGGNKAIDSDGYYTPDITGCDYIGTSKLIYTGSSMAVGGNITTSSAVGYVKIKG